MSIFQRKSDRNWIVSRRTKGLLFAEQPTSHYRANGAAPSMDAFAIARSGVVVPDVAIAIRVIVDHIPVVGITPVVRHGNDVFAVSLINQDAGAAVAAAARIRDAVIVAPDGGAAGLWATAQQNPDPAIIRRAVGVGNQVALRR